MLITRSPLALLDPVTDDRKYLRQDALFPAWHPTENRIIYSARSEGIGIFDFDTDEETIIELPIPGMFPDWHPTENEIIFTGDLDNHQERIYSLELDCIQTDDCAEQLVEFPGATNQRHAVWNSTGEYLLVQQQVKIAAYHAVLLNHDGDLIRQITPSDKYDGAPVWGPCDRYVVTTRSNQDYYNPDPNIIIIDLMTDEVTQIITDGGGSASWWWDADEIDCEPFDLESQ